MVPENSNVPHRCLKRVLDRVLDDIGQAERCSTARGRLRFANDPMRRDAAEQCLQRIQNAIPIIEKLDSMTYASLFKRFDVLAPSVAASSIDRMDSDVLFSLIELCRTELRDTILAVFEERSRH